MLTQKNYMKLEFPARSVNEGFARAAVAAFAAQLDPTLAEIGDIKTAVSEAVTNAVVHAYPDKLGTVQVRVRILPGRAAGDRRQGSRHRHRRRGAGAHAAVYHRRGRTQRHGLYDHGELYGHPAGQVCARAAAQP